ncbi:MAG: hypothetical protein GWP91_24470, partial [Rhodobacterales bacterium]|nr:hypothetical protein [Rhodobacterales bacterium]
SAFADTPSLVNCALTDLDTLATSQSGSLSRAFPPEAVGMSLTCANIEIDGLPPANFFGGDGTTDADVKDGNSGGCGCSASAAPTGAWIWMALLLIIGCKRGEDAKNQPDDTTTTWPASTGIWSTGTDFDQLAAIGDTTWHGRADFGEGERVYEFTFGSSARIVAETRNPWGPARARTMRTITPTAAGLETLVNNPAGWEASELEGEASTWQVSVAEGDLRTLSLTREGVTATFDEGPEPTPTMGLTAIARSFVRGGRVDYAFCSSGTSGFDYATLFDFARGGHDEDLITEEVVAGATLGSWIPSSGNFDLNELNQFDRDGGTSVNARHNWMVRYVGTVDHPGGEFSIRERNDSVEDGLWVWMDQDVGTQTNRLFLEVHGFVFADSTADEPSESFDAGDLPIEVILVRCDNPIEDVQLQISSQGSNWSAAANAPSLPEVSPLWFPGTF